MNLARFSLQHVTGHRQPRVYDNTERMQAFRASQPVVFANTRFNRAPMYASEADYLGSSPDPYPEREF